MRRLAYTLWQLRLNPPLEHHIVVRLATKVVVASVSRSGGPPEPDICPVIYRDVDTIGLERTNSKSILDAAFYPTREPVESVPRLLLVDCDGGIWRWELSEGKPSA